MTEITLCGYYGMCDSEGKSVGHTVKVTSEYYELLKTDNEVKIMASPSIVNGVGMNLKEVSTMLPYDIDNQNLNSLKKRLIDKWKVLTNIRYCMKKVKKGTLFFYQVDFFFFLYMFFHRKIKDKKIICLIYHQNFYQGKCEKILQYIYRKAIVKIDGILYTQKGNPPIHKNIMWMPDYLYDEKKYSYYQKKIKQNKVVCVGTMNLYKQLEELVHVFSSINYPLEIVGRFDDENRFQKLLQIKTPNITIQNKILDSKDYYETIGNAKFSILPYNMEKYKNRTSGVLLESIYVGSIPIAPQKLLKQNNLPGFGYMDMGELQDCLWMGYKMEDSFMDNPVFRAEENAIRAFFS